MAYNYQLHNTNLDEISQQTIREAIFLCYKDGITTIAPLGFAGDDVLLHGHAGGGRISVVSIRNYCGNAELLITDTKGKFLFYGRYDINLGIEFIAEQYWKIFLQVYDLIDGAIENVSEFANIKLADNCEASEGFAMLKAYQNAHKEIQSNDSL
jgi:hypothetical protein